MEKEKHPFEPVFNQIADMISQVYKNKNPVSTDLPPNIEEEIVKLKETLEQIKRDAQELTIRIKSQIEVPSEIKPHPLELPPSHKRMFNRAQEVERDAIILEKEIKKVINKPRAKSAPKKKESGLKAKNTIKDRKKRFKPLGGDKNWIPM